MRRCVSAGQWGYDGTDGSQKYFSPPEIVANKAKDVVRRDLFLWTGQRTDGENAANCRRLRGDYCLAVHEG